MTTKIKISKSTLDILKNFASISNGIAFKEGMPLKVVSPRKDIFAKANVDEKFPDHSIYEVSKFLGVLNTFKDPELTYTDKMVTIASGPAKVDYYFAAEGLITYNEKEFKPADPIYSFKLSAGQIQQTLTIASQLRHNEMQFLADGSKVYVRAVTSTNKKIDETNAFSLEKGDVDDVTFDCSINMENVKLIDGDYTVDVYIIGDRGIIKFAHDTVDLVYYISTLSKS